MNFIFFIKCWNKINSNKKIRKTFSDIDKCRIYEQITLRRLNVLHNNKWLNKNINGRFLPTGPQTPEHKKARSNALKGHLPTFTKKHSIESCEKMRLAQLGKSKSPEHIANMRNRPQDTMRLICPHCDKEGDYKNMKRWHMDKCKYQSHNAE